MASGELDSMAQSVDGGNRSSRRGIRCAGMLWCGNVDFDGGDSAWLPSMVAQAMHRKRKPRPARRVVAVASVGGAAEPPTAAGKNEYAPLPATRPRPIEQ